VREREEWNGKLKAFNGNLHAELHDVVADHQVAVLKVTRAACEAPL